MQIDRQSYRRISMAVVVLGSWQLSGCNPASFVTIPPITIDLAASNVDQFDVEAGAPLKRAIGGVGGSDTRGFDLTGSIELKASAISVTPSDSADNKLAALQQVVDDCSTACAAAEVDAAICDDVCSNGELQITAWVAELGDATVCDGGDNTDQYGPYVVTLDDNGQVVSVSPSSFTLTARTQTWIATAGVTLCIEVISPITGTVSIDSLVINLSL